jgi:hypothetical protein
MPPTKVTIRLQLLDDPQDTAQLKETKRFFHFYNLFAFNFGAKNSWLNKIGFGFFTFITAICKGFR